MQSTINTKVKLYAIAYSLCSTLYVQILKPNGATCVLRRRLLSLPNILFGLIVN